MTLDEYIQQLSAYIRNNMQDWCNELEPTIQINHFENTQTLGEDEETQVLIPGTFQERVDIFTFHSLRSLISKEITLYQQREMDRSSFFQPTLLRTPPCRFLIILS